MLTNQLIKQQLTPQSLRTEKQDSKEVKFKSSPDIVYYEKQSPEKELACHPDDKLILTEDLSTAESELNEEAKALYHKVLSSKYCIGLIDSNGASAVLKHYCLFKFYFQVLEDPIQFKPVTELCNLILNSLSAAHTEDSQAAPAAPAAAAETEPTTKDEVPTPEAAVEPAVEKEEKTPTPEAAEEEQLVEMARELTDSVIKNASGHNSPKPEVCLYSRSPKV